MTDWIKYILAIWMLTIYLFANAFFLHRLPVGIRPSEDAFSVGFFLIIASLLISALHHPSKTTRDLGILMGTVVAGIYSLWASTGLISADLIFLITCGFVAFGLNRISLRTNTKKEDRPEFRAD